jgi:hypothetical protein
MGDTETRMHPQLDEIRRKPGLFTNHPEVCHQGQAQASSHCRSMNGCDNGFTGAKQAHRVDIQVVGAPLRAGVEQVPPGTGLKIGPGAECLTLGRQYDGATLIDIIEIFKRIRQARYQGCIEKIMGWPSHLDDRHMPDLIQVDIAKRL